MIHHHWNYFLAIEDDVCRLSRYIDLNKDNYSAFSIEMTRILMMSTQEVDVIFKQICNNDSNNEECYRSRIPTLFPRLPSHRIFFNKFGISCTPFHSWCNSPRSTPVWWTANNKIKHSRNLHFQKGSLENALNAFSALFIACIYHYHNLDCLNIIRQPSALLYCENFPLVQYFSGHGTYSEYNID